MRNHQLVTRDFLQLFDVVQSKGKNTDGVREFEGIKVWHDYDGYTCWLEYKDLSVTLMFHGNLVIKCQDDELMNEFYHLCQSLTRVSSRVE
ncbi:DUF3081 family protein [uncultured Vibrio sp.]|mgnify:CR=1 FL=1|uniref:DUF3081 family protein n=1 Tax=uncultured Vibrio sp. TaxID=114054 RepID=UPI00345B4D80